MVAVKVLRTVKVALRRLKPLRGGESRVATVKDSLWLYDNEDEDENLFEVTIKTA